MKKWGNVVYGWPLRRVSQIFVAFSEKLNFKKVSDLLSHFSPMEFKKLVEHNKDFFDICQYYRMFSERINVSSFFITLPSKFALDIICVCLSHVLVNVRVL